MLQVLPMLKAPPLILLCALSLVWVHASAQAQSGDEADRPNILLVLADDLGFSDLGAYGGEISTPTLDRLAEQGMRFTNYHTAANCAPARAMLLTGVDAHLAGVPNIPEMLAPEQMRHDHYQGVLGHNVVTVASLLENVGFNTYMAGKWHLGTGPGKLPSARGFMRTVALADSGADNWEQKPYLPIYDKANWYADGEPYDLPEDFYSSRFLVDKTIEFIDSNLNDDKPFFAYLPFQAVHIPVQAPQEFIDRYMGVYDSGWDVLRQQRLERASALGIVPEQTAMVTMSTTADWSALNDEQQRYEAKRMAVYAAMVEAMDFHLGRLLEYLEQQGKLENTLVVFTSDNGAEASGPPRQNAPINQLLLARMDYNTNYETLGLKGSYNTISPSFASAAASPLAYYKFYAGEGGMRVPLIVTGPGVVAGEIDRAFTFVTDITPTLLSYAGVAAPGRRFAGRTIEPMSGRSLMPLLTGAADRVYGPEDAVGYELAGHAALFQGDYKLVRNRPPVGDGVWRMFNLLDDPGETEDLSQREAARFEAMKQAYADYATENKVLAPPAGYTHTGQLIINTLHGRLRESIVVLLLLALLLVPTLMVHRRYRA